MSAARALAEAAVALREEARDHKRAERAHRREARALMERYRELERICAAHGIQIEAKAKGAIANE